MGKRKVIAQPVWMEMPVFKPYVREEKVKTTKHSWKKGGKKK